MPTRHSHRPPLRPITAMPLGLVGGALIAAIAGLPSPAATRPIAIAHAPASYAWSPQQVRQLIVAIEEARRHGLDPADYGLAALRAELDLCEQLWNTPGSRQLDTLARTAALALANDYRRQAIRTAPVRPADLDAALGAGRVGSWLTAQAPEGRIS